MNAKWNPAVKAMALRRSAIDPALLSLRKLLPRSSLVLGMAVNWPFTRLGKAFLNVAPRSGLVVLRYRVHQLVSTESCVRLVKRPTCLAPVAWLLGNVAKCDKSTGSAPFEIR